MTNIYGLGPFRLDTHCDLLFRGTEPTALGRRALALLRALVDQPGAVVSKDALIEAAWSDQAVEESNLTVQIAALRRVLGEEPGGDRWIETMPRRGYRFVGPVVSEEEYGVVDARATQHGDAERRQITALSCELMGIAGQADVIDLEDLCEVVDAFQRCVSETVGRHNGFVSSHFGNTVFVLFGYPAAREHDAEQAVRAGLALCAAVRTLRPSADVPIRCRVGIATGMVIVGNRTGVGEHRDQGIVGDAPHLAARLQALAQPDTVAIEPVTRRLIGNLFDCRDLCAIDTNGGTAPMRSWQVLGESIVASRFEALQSAALTPLVGREEEMELLLRRWQEAKSGDGRVVLLSGEPGIGKSRIATVLLEKLQTEPHMLLRYFCSPYHTESALHPTISQLEHAARFEHKDSSATKLDKLTALLTRTAATREEVALAAELLSLPVADAAVHCLTPRQKKERIFNALVRRLGALAQEMPLLMLLEDAHWADPSSRELLDRVVERVPHLPVLLVITFRPEYHPPWVGLPNIALLTLTRLGQREAALLAERVALGMALPAEVLNQIVKRADGIPLFIEELTKTLLESSLLREQNKSYVLDGPLPRMAIPMSLHASLTARLDHLGSARPVAQIGAAMGREFSYPLLRAVSSLPEDELQAALARLVASELVFQRGTPLEAVYAFKHALVQDAAHGTLLRNARQQLHAQIAEALEAHSPELIDRQPELLAQHYAEAGLVEKSVASWGKAGRRSAARSAMVEAATQLQKGLDQLKLLPNTLERQRQKLEFYSALAAVLLVVKGPAAPETGHAYACARELWEQLGSPSELLRIPYWQSLYYLHRGELDLALRSAEDLLRLSGQRNDSGGLVLGHLSAGLNLMLAGKFASSRSHLEEALALYDPTSHRALFHQVGFHPQLVSRAYLGLVLFCLGHPDRALARSSAAIAEARGLAHPPSLVVTLAMVVRLLWLVGDDAALDERSEELVALAAEQDFPFWHAQGTICRGWVKVENGDVAGGISLLRSGLIAYRATGAGVGMTTFTPLLIRAYEISGKIDEALTLSDDVLQIAEKIGECWQAAELNRHKGQLLLRQGHTEAAEDLYRKALTIATEQGAKLWELRAAMSLARLRRDQGRHAEACDLLAPVYGWFTEGFDTPDLLEAKALLDELV